MTDTPLHIQKLQQEIWMKKSPQERLLQFLKDNEELFKQLNNVKQNIVISEHLSKVEGADQSNSIKI